MPGTSRISHYLFALYLIATSLFGVENPEWRTLIPPDHPRLFFNRETFSQIAELALSKKHAELQQKNGQVGLRFRHSQRIWEVDFGTAGDPSGSLRMKEDGVTRLERELTGQIMP